LLSEINFDPKAAGEQTIDALVRELLRPMMKEWLDENLAEIVEQQVETEVRRIASMAR
jgi:cell pole-organizing protein PopZ